MSRQISNWFVPAIWNDGECWIIGGGISFPRQFGVSESIIKQVMDKKLSMSAYSDYFKPLYDCHVIGTNVAYLLGDWISVLYFGDLPFYRENIGQLQNFKNLKITDTGNLPYSEAYLQRNIKRLRRDMSPGITDYADCLCWNRNSGAAAINLAIHFGVKRILLLGFDMNADECGKTHWHAGLPNYNRPCNPGDFKRYLERFDAIAKAAEVRHVEIINVNPVSAIKEFPKVNLKDVL